MRQIVSGFRQIWNQQLNILLKSQNIVFGRRQIVNESWQIFSIKMATTCASYTSSILFGGMRERRRMCFDKGCSCWTKFDHNWSILTFLGKFDKILMSIAFTITMRQDVNTSETLVTEILLSPLPSRSQPVQPYFPTLHFMSVFALKTTKSPALPKSAQWEERLWRGRKSSELTLKDFPPSTTLKDFPPQAPLMDFPPAVSSFRLILNPVWYDLC